MSDGENCPTQFLSAELWCSFYGDTKQEIANPKIWEADSLNSWFIDLLIFASLNISD